MGELYGYIIEKLSSLGYKITIQDIDKNEKNAIGVYIKPVGNPELDIRGQSRIVRYDLSIRLHTDITQGSIEKGFRDLKTIESLLVTSNLDIDNLRILGITMRSAGELLGKTTNNIPVFNIAFLITI